MTAKDPDLARGRMISKTLSTSQKRSALHQVVPELAEFCQQLYPLLVAHADDFGRLSGDPFTIKHAIDPTSPRPLADFATALQVLHEVDLIVWYAGDNARRFVQVTQFDEHQTGLHKRSASAFPNPPGAIGLVKTSKPISGLDASEEDLEAFIADELRDGRLRIGGLSVLNLKRQVRTANSYCDIVADTAEGITLLIEVKRARVSVAAIEQVLNYRKLLAGDRSRDIESIAAVVIGPEITVGLNVMDCGALIATISESLTVSGVAFITVQGRYLTLDHKANLPTEGKRTEGKRRELKKDVSSAPPSDAEPALLTFPTVGSGAKTWGLTEAHVTAWLDAYPGLDVLGECRRALAWVNANQAKTAKGMPAFLVNWFNRAVQRGGNSRPLGLAANQGAPVNSGYTPAALARIKAAGGAK